MKVEFERSHLRAAEKAALLMRLMDEADQRAFMGTGSADRTLAVEFMDELVSRMRDRLDETSSTRTDFASNVTRLGVSR